MSASEFSTTLFLERLRYKTLKDFAREMVTQKMSSHFTLFQLILIDILYGYECPQSQQNDTHRVCNIFQTTNIESIIQQDMTIDNYCNWYPNQASNDISSSHWEIICDSSNTDIISIQFMYDYALNGTLNTEFSWPQHLEQLILYDYTEGTRHITKYIHCGLGTYIPISCTASLQITQMTEMGISNAHQ